MKNIMMQYRRFSICFLLKAKKTEIDVITTIVIFLLKCNHDLIFTLSCISCVLLLRSYSVGVHCLISEINQDLWDWAFVQSRISSDLGAIHLWCPHGGGWVRLQWTHVDGGSSMCMSTKRY